MEREMRSLLAEIGFMAGGHGYHEEAEKICDGLEADDPEDGKPVIIRALSRMNQGQAEAAARLLEQALAAGKTERPLLQAFLGMAYHLAGRSGDKHRILEQLVDAAEDPQAVEMARAFL